MSSRKAGILFFSRIVFREVMIGIIFSMKFLFWTCRNTNKSMLSMHIHLKINFSLIHFFKYTKSSRLQRTVYHLIRILGTQRAYVQLVLRLPAQQHMQACTAECIFTPLPTSMF